MARDHLAVFVVLLSLSVPACSDDSSVGSTSVPACNTLVDDGPTVSYTAIAAAAPVPAGGTFSDGTYEIAALNLYAGVGGSTAPVAATARGVMTISGNTMQEVGTVNGHESRYTSTYTLSGTTVATTDSCPARDSSTHQFTATATEIRIYDANGTVTLEQVYRKR